MANLMGGSDADRRRSDLLVKIRNVLGETKPPDVEFYQSRDEDVGYQWFDYDKEWSLYLIAVTKGGLIKGGYIGRDMHPVYEWIVPGNDTAQLAKRLRSPAAVKHLCGTSIQ